MAIAALDPGRDKCGLAVLEDNASVLCQKVIATEALTEEMECVDRIYAPKLLVLGNGTTSQEAKEKIQRAFPRLPIAIVDEYRTTELAKKAYWEVSPPKGWRRLLPVTMQVPPVPVDDYVAVILGRRFLRQIN